MYHVCIVNGVVSHMMEDLDDKPTSIIMADAYSCASAYILFKGHI